MRTKYKLGFPLAASIALGLSACGGGGGDTPSALAASADSVPTSAGASARAFSDYLKAMTPSDSTEPLLTQGFVPPIDDKAEPLPIT